MEEEDSDQELIEEIEKIEIIVTKQEDVKGQKIMTQHSQIKVTKRKVKKQPGEPKRKYVKKAEYWSSSKKQKVED